MTLLHGRFSRFLNRTNGTKSPNVPQTILMTSLNHKQQSEKLGQFVENVMEEVTRKIKNFIGLGTGFRLISKAKILRLLKILTS